MNRAQLMAVRLKNKQCAEHELHSAHGCAVKNNKQRAEHEPHLAHGRAVNK